MITNKRLLVLEIPDKKELHKDFLIEGGRFDCFDLMEHFKGYILNPEMKAEFSRSIEAIQLFSELDYKTLVIQNRFKPFEVNLK